jgi:hypothetical protein
MIRMDGVVSAKKPKIASGPDFALLKPNIRSRLFFSANNCLALRGLDIDRSPCDM